MIYSKLHQGSFVEDLSVGLAGEVSLLRLTLELRLLDDNVLVELGHDIVSVRFVILQLQEAHTIVQLFLVQRSVLLAVDGLGFSSMFGVLTLLKGLGSRFLLGEHGSFLVGLVGLLSLVLDLQEGLAVTAALTVELHDHTVVELRLISGVELRSRGIELGLLLGRDFVHLLLESSRLLVDLLLPESGVSLQQHAIIHLGLVFSIEFRSGGVGLGILSGRRLVELILHLGSLLIDHLVPVGRVGMVASLE